MKWEASFMNPQPPSLAALKFKPSTPMHEFHPSPIAWEDQVFYFLMLDRFSNGNENGYKDNLGNLVRSGTIPLLTPGDRNNAIKTEHDAVAWREAGTTSVGGTLKRLLTTIRGHSRLDQPRI
jgi:hypothetical protein